ncbi:MAG: hypothetical protein FWH51_02400 [Dehalococcoidia bacterium]|nr:hypothetical protein [Dehalococcoidia bacterium]
MSIAKTAKWELRKCVLYLRWVILPWMALLLAAYLLPESVTRVSWLSSSFSAMLAIGMIIGMLVLSVYPGLSVMVGLRAPYGLLEKMRSQPYVITATTKTILNVLLFSLGWGLVMLTYEVSHKFSAITLLPFGGIPYIKAVFYAAISVPTVVMSAIVAASSVPLLRNHAFVGSLVSGLVKLGLTVFAIFILIGAGFGGKVLNTGAISAQCVVVITLFAVSCWLYDNKYEVSNLKTK